MKIWSLAPYVQYGHGVIQAHHLAYRPIFGRLGVCRGRGKDGACMTLFGSVFYDVMVDMRCRDKNDHCHDRNVLLSELQCNQGTVARRVVRSCKIWSISKVEN